MKQLLFTVPDLSVIGGVASHFIGLKPHWKSDVEYFTIGRRQHLPAFITIIPDYCRFFFRLLCGTKPNVVLLNTSLRFVPIFRDLIFSLICKLFGLKTVMFIHGWNPSVQAWFATHQRLARFIFNRHEFIYVLYSQFKQDLIGMGVKIPIKLTTTKVADELIEGFDINSKEGKIKQLLFLARVDRKKGLDITIKAFELLKPKYPELSLCICGDGIALQENKEYVASHHLKDVYFEGFVSGDLLKKHLFGSQVYILPTREEGMATSVLEAMATGLVVISRPVGGVRDFFVNGEMGWLIDSFAPQDYADKIELLLNDADLVKSIATNNYEYAKSHFLASSVAAAIERDLATAE